MQRNSFPLVRNTTITPGMRVLVRVDFNVPIENSEVRGEFRIMRSLKTINYLRERGAKIILVSHVESTSSLEPVSLFLKNHVPHTFVVSLRSDAGQEVLSKMKNGDIVLLENIRHESGEKTNDSELAEFLASLADLYVNDAFSVSHRAHASIVGIPRFLPGCAGFLLEEEIMILSRALTPKKPFLFILGGAKFETKLPLIRKFQHIANTIIIGGALANDIYKAKGLAVGRSLVSGEVDLSEIINDSKIIVPSEIIAKRGSEVFTTAVKNIESEDSIIDASPEWIRSLEETIANARTILWNGPVGKYESEGKAGTVELAKLIAKSSAYSIVGGGDTLAVIAEHNLEEKFSFISTGGGAMLDFLANGSLPGIRALTQSGS
ncbi:MAG: phosphoglycerate kinase [Candidatus Paceibacterota bacterium]